MKLPIYITTLSAASALLGVLAFAQSPSSPSTDRHSPNRPGSAMNPASPTTAVPPGTDPSANPHASDAVGKSQTPTSAREARSASGSPLDPDTSSLNSARREGLILPRSSGNIAHGAEATATVHAIQTQPVTAQRQLVAELEQRIDESTRELRRRNSSGSDASMKSAQENLQQAEQQLRESLRQARSATAENWESARSALAADYAAYATAVSNVQMAAAASSRSMEGRSTLPGSSESTSDRDNPIAPRNP